MQDTAMRLRLCSSHQCTCSRSCVLAMRWLHVTKALCGGGGDGSGVLRRQLCVQGRDA